MDFTDLIRAQAGNVGVFATDGSQTTTEYPHKDCSSLLVVIGPIANLCYAMAMGNTEVISLQTLSHDCSHAQSRRLCQRDQRFPEGAEVDLNVSSINLDATGWIKSENIGYNGNCEIGP
jgi:hypothetical protein